MYVKPEACFRLKLQDKQIALFDRWTGGVSYSVVCALGAIACQELSDRYSPRDPGTKAETSNQGASPGRQHQRLVTQV